MRELQREGERKFAFPLEPEIKREGGRKRDRKTEVEGYSERERERERQRERERKE